ncbi:MAG TPA: 7TM diverse intracellular signaling domain-containing protein, partial [Blastocatellia bacterium]|nr:7TM diverse intracellular signaling domain-containing protein [Blastocatellia bacterium]
MMEGNLYRAICKRVVVAGLLCALGFLGGSAFARGSEEASATGWSQSAVLPEGVDINGLRVLEDTTGSATLEQVLEQRDRFQEVKVKTPNYRYTTSAYWFHMTAKNRRSEPVRLYLDIKHTLMDYVTLYVMGRDNRREIVHTGDRMAGRDRPYPAATCVLPFHLEAGESADLYFRIRADASVILVPVEVLDENAMRASVFTRRLLHGAMLGLFGALFFYNLFVYLLLRERTYLYYVVYLLFAYLSMSSLDGFGSIFIYTGTTWPSNEGLMVFAGITFALILQFTREFLRTGKHSRLDLCLKIMIGINVFLSLSPLLMPIQLAYRLMTLMTFVFPTVSMAVGIIAWRQGKREARFYILGQAASWISLLAFGLVISDVLPFHMFHNDSISMGISADALLLSFALADRIRILQEDRRKAEIEARR